MECEDTKHKDKNNNGTEINIVTSDKETEKCTDITSPDMMKEYGNKEHDNKYFNKKKPICLPWIKKQKNSQISHPQI